MNLTFRGLMIGFAASLFAGSGCSSGGGSARTYPDPVVLDGGVSHMGFPDGGAAETAAPLPPMSGEGNVLLFAGAASLLSHGPACTNEVGATSDRWCAFVSPSTSTLGRDNLFVINVSQAAAGTSITCGGGKADPNCLKLTGGFFEEASTPFPHAAAFQGDSLIYFDLTGTGYGWRPGMSNGRVLAMANSLGSLHDCSSSAKGTSVLCLNDLATQSVMGITQSQLMAGHLDATTDPPLTAVDTVISADSTVTANQQRFRLGFSPDGASVNWSSAQQMGGLEVLKTQKVGDDSTRITVATDVSRWTTSPDGTRWYWLSHFNYDIMGMRSGDLQTAPFPAGMAPTTLIPSVGDFTLARSGSVVVRAMVSKSLGDLRAIPDPVGAPTGVVMLDTGVVGFLAIGSQGHVVYTKNVEPTFSFLDLYVQKLDGTGSVCALTAKTDGQRSLFFLPGGGALVWAQVTNLDSPTDVNLMYRESFTRLSDCTTTPVASNIGSYGIAGDTGVLIEDDFDGTAGTLRLQTVTAGEVLGTQPPVLIQTQVNNYMPVAPSPGVVMFTVSANSTSDGLYLHLIAPPPSGGVDAATESASGDGGAQPDASVPDVGAADDGPGDDGSGG